MLQSEHQVVSCKVSNTHQTVQDVMGCLVCRSSADEQGGTVPEGAGWESGTGEIVGKQHVEDVPFGEPVMLTREQRMAKMKNALDHLGPIVSRKELFDNAQKVMIVLLPSSLRGPCTGC